MRDARHGALPTLTSTTHLKEIEMREIEHDEECAEDIANTGACRHGHAFRTPPEGCGRPGCVHNED